MREKLAIAKQLRISRRRSKTLEVRKLYSKCYWAYVMQCVVYGKDDFVILYTGKWLYDSAYMFKKWLEYYEKQMRRFCIKHFVPASKITTKQKIFLDHPEHKPFNMKVTDVPDETLLYCILERNGFEVTNEHMRGTWISYDVSRA